ncbi:MAG: DNA double-strand break repair nuclease NurA [Promethearchaeota archaeon]
MLDSTFEETLKNKGEILKLIEFYQGMANLPRNVWIDIDIKERANTLSIGGVDGSYNRKEFMGFVIYAIGSECVIHDVHSSSGLKMEGGSHVGVLQPYDHIKNRLEYYMSIFELKTAIEALRNHSLDLLLLDGSIQSYLITPLPSLVRLSEGVMFDLQKNYLKEIEDEIDNGGIGITSLKFLDSLYDEYGDGSIQAITFLEYLECLLTIRHLLLKYSDKVIGISKKSKVTDYFKKMVPDQAIFEYNFPATGFSRPIEIVNIQKWKYPIYQDFFKSRRISYFFARLERRKNVIKLEFPRKLSSNWKDEIIELLENLKYISTEGYPYLLKRAHDDVVIRQGDLRQIIKILGIIDKDGREML